MSDCIFCKIGTHDIPSNVVYEDDKLICFHDLEPQAPVHVLVIPKKHLTSLDDVSEEDQELLGYIMFKIHEIAESLGLEGGYRVVSNNGEDHFRLLSTCTFTCSEREKCFGHRAKNIPCLLIEKIV